jgi:tetratricopeptide (TPR) repeat protein
MRKWLGGALVAVAALIGPSTASAGGALVIAPGYPENWGALDGREVMMLPTYCKYTQLYRDAVHPPNLEAQIRHWRAVMGPIFHAMHHYCHGLLKTNRALLLAGNEQTKRFYLDSAITEYDYVLTRAPENFILLPEILTKKGEDQLRLNREAQAVETLEQAMKLKPDYWPPYTALADYYKAHGKPAEARKILEKALEHSPDAQAVKRRLAELGTKRAGD